MICQNCLKNAATVHVTEILQQPAQADAPTPQVHEQHLCEVCAQTMELPHAPSAQKAQLDIWKLLQLTAQQTRRRGGPTCAGCGMGLEEFRRKGRLGCPKCYDAFGAHLSDVLERVHGARKHVGRLPGASPEDVERSRRLVELRQRLETAIREEAYESAARLRDELRQLEGPSPA
jgi:protein arginine kinase activator